MAFTAPLWEVGFDREKWAVREEWLLGRFQPGLPVERSGRDDKQTVTYASLTFRRALHVGDFKDNVGMYVFLRFVECCARHLT